MHRRIVAAAVLVVAGGCEQSAPPRTSAPALAQRGADSTSDTRAAEMVCRPPDGAPPLLEPSHAEDSSIADAVWTAYPSSPIDPPGFERIMARLSQAGSSRERGAWVFAAARRAPASAIGRLWVSAGAEVEPLARGLCGRSRGTEPTAFPPPLSGVLTAGQFVPAVASFVARSGLALPLGSEEVGLDLLLGGGVERAVAGARIFRGDNSLLPRSEAFDIVPPRAIPALTRSLTGRREIAPASWLALLDLLSRRAALAPRLWGNAWISARDAAPRTMAGVSDALLQGCAAVLSAGGLPEGTAAHFRCGNAAVIDELRGSLQETLRCAGGSVSWIALREQASVVGRLRQASVRRSTVLTSILERAHGDVRVVEAVATAAVSLPVDVASTGLIRRLAAERDPGVLSALLEGLTLHVQHAAALTPGQRAQLLQAPFALPEPLAAEAQTHAHELALLLRTPSAIGNPPTPHTRAVRAVAAPDADAPHQLDPIPTPTAADTILRLSTDAGTLEIRIQQRRAARAAQQVLQAVANHRYDGLDIHRVVPGFVIQGADPRGDGYGGTETTILTELSLQPFHRGSVGIPLAGLDTGGIQIFIVLEDAPELDGRYPWIGDVIGGMDTVDAMMVGDRILRAEVVALDSR